MVSSRVQVIGAQLNEFQSKLQDSLNKFNKENAVYQAGIQKNLEQARIDMQDAQKEADLTLQASIQDYTLELQRFQADLGKYQADVAKEVQEYGQKLSQYQLELNTSFQAWSKTESDKIAKYQSDIQNELNDFNEGVTEYQAQLQISIQDAQLSSQDDAQKLQKYSQELQSYTSEVNQKAQKIASATQNASYYSNESKKYYDWAIAEVTMYIKNNSKMINQTMAAQAAQG